MAESTARKRKAKETVSNVQPMPSTRTRKTKPLSTPEGRETQLINKAINLAEKQLDEGTASAAVITHYLKMASKKEFLEREILEKQAKLLQAKAESLETSRDAKELYEHAIEAMRSYSGND